MSPAATCPWWTRYSPSSSVSVRAIKPGPPQRIVPSSLLLRVFNVLLLLSCSPVGSITAHGAVAGAKVRESGNAQRRVLGACLLCIQEKSLEVIVFLDSSVRLSMRRDTLLFGRQSERNALFCTQLLPASPRAVLLDIDAA